MAAFNVHEVTDDGWGQLIMGCGHPIMRWGHSWNLMGTELAWNQEMEGSGKVIV